MVASVALTPAVTAVAVADPGADLSVTATWVGNGAPRAAVGQTVTYTITVTNLGPATATGAVLTASTPDQFNFVSLTCSQASFCGSGGELAPGATTAATLVDVVCCFPKGESRTTSAGAGVTSADDPRISNDTASVVTRILGPNGFSFPG
jgi:uncharacterized repeat protein (TIGR01451 family)